MATSDTKPVSDERDSDLNVVYACSLDFTEHVRLSVPVECFALTHYHSQLVLVGGVRPDTKDPTNELWVSADGSNWQPLLPPMKVKRYSASAVNTGSPECLVVAGGCLAYVAHNPDDLWVTIVEVLLNEEWFTVQPFPRATLPLPRSFIHNGTLIITGAWSMCLCCRVESLLASCFQSQGDGIELSSCDLWNRFYYDPYIQISSLYSFGQQLVGIGSAGVLMLCPSTHTWLKLGELPHEDYYCHVTGAVLPTGEMVIMSECEVRTRLVHKASLNCK